MKQGRNPSNQISEKSFRFRGWKKAQQQGPEAVHFFHQLKHKGFGVRQMSNQGIETIRNGRQGLPRPLNAAPSSSPSRFPGFQLRPSLPTGAIPYGVAVGDFNSDGKLDWVVSNSGDNTLNIYFGKGDGTSQLPIFLPCLGTSPLGVAVADLNSDGKQDIVVAEADSNTIGIFFGNGDGTFQPEVQLGLPNSPFTVAVGALRKAGPLDLIVGIAGDTAGLAQNSRFAALLGDGKGTFSAPIFAPNPTNMIVEGTELSLGDANGDGIKDVLVTGPDAEGTTVQVYLGNGDGTFTPGQIVDESNGAPTLDSAPPNAVFSDVNQDGCLDVVDVDAYGLALVFYGDCKGDFPYSSVLKYGMGDSGYGLAVADVNGDGYPDIISGGVLLDSGTGILGSFTGNTVTVRLNDGTGHFGPAHVYRGDPGIYDLAVADLKGTGHPEIVAVNQNANSLTVYHNDGTGGFGPPSGGYEGFYEGPITAATPNSTNLGMMTADVDGDGRPDLAWLENPGTVSTSEVGVMLNLGNGAFSAPVRSSFLSGDMEWSVSDFMLADVRHTGSCDFLAEAFNVAASQAEIIFAPNVGGGHFGAASSTLIPTISSYGFGAFAVGDFNADGKLDVAVTTSTGATGQQLTVFLGNGDGTFKMSTQMEFANGAGFVVAGAMFVDDANGDGHQDIFVWLTSNGGIGTDLYEFLGNGDGTFIKPIDVLQNVTQMTMADLNHDGRLDVIDLESMSMPNYIPGTAPATVNIYLGQANGGFGPATSYVPYPGIFDNEYRNAISSLAAGELPYLGDFNGDGNLDLAIFQKSTLAVGNASVQFLVGNGDGSFTPSYDSFPMDVPYIPSLAVQNLLGDGSSSFVQSNSLTSSYQVIASTPAPSFQIGLAEVPVLGGADVVNVVLNFPSNSQTTISLSSSDPNVQVPASVTVPAGATVSQVPFTLANNIAVNRWFSITGQLGTETQVAYGFPGSQAADAFLLEVVPPAIPTVIQAGYPSQLYSAGIQSVGDATGSFQFSCSNLPGDAYCQFLLGVSTVSVSGGLFGNVLLSVVTSTNTPSGNFTFDILATDGERTFSSSQAMTVTPAPSGLQPSATQVSFSTLSGTTAPQQMVVLTNVGTSSVSGIALQPASAISTANGTFQLQTTCGSQLAAGASCGIGISFAGLSPGNATATLNVLNSVLPLSIALSGTSEDFEVQLSPSTPGSMTISAGQSASFSLLVVPDFFQGQIGLACTGAPALSTCSLSPNSVALNGAAIPFQAVLTTTAAKTQIASNTPEIPKTLLGVFISISSVAALFLLFARTQKSRSGAIRAVCCGLLIFATIWFVASCGGGSSSFISPPPPPPIPGTTPGTYQLTITGATGSDSHSLAVTVTIQ